MRVATGRAGAGAAFDAATLRIDLDAAMLVCVRIWRDQMDEDFVSRLQLLMAGSARVLLVAARR